MLLKVVSAIGILVLIFLFYVSMKPGHFSYSRNGIIKAPPEKIFPYLSQLKMGSMWSPYEKIDPNMKHTFIGTDGIPGAKMEFEGNSKAGSGSLEMLSMVPNQKVEYRLLMTKPMKADNRVVYTLEPTPEGTRFIWTMTGESNFIGKLFSTLIDCEKMVGGQFEEGIQNLKKVVESQK